MNGATQIRAGVIRPEVIIPLAGDDLSSKIKNLSENDMIISVNSNVRVIRTPYFGKVGKVVSLPSELMEMESGKPSYARINLFCLDIHENTCTLICHMQTYDVTFL